MPYTLSTHSVNHANIAYAKGCWSFDVVKWRSHNIKLLDETCDIIGVGEIVILYCSDKSSQGIVMIGDIRDKSLVGMSVTDLWPGEFRNLLRVRWWNQPSLISMDRIRNEMPFAQGRRRYWHLDLNILPLNFVQRNRNKLKSGDIYYLIDQLPVDRTIDRVRNLLSDRKWIIQ